MYSLKSDIFNLIVSALVVIIPGAIGYFILERYFGLGLVGLIIGISTIAQNMWINAYDDLKKHLPQHSVTLRMAIMCQDADYSHLGSNDCTKYATYDKDITLQFIPSIGMSIFEHKVIAIDVYEELSGYNCPKIFCIVECEFKDKEWFQSENASYFENKLIIEGWKKINLMPFYIHYCQTEMLNYNARL
jgi:hypothetical protein